MSKRLVDRSTFVAAMFFFALLLAMADADCAIDSKSTGCNFTNGKVMSILFPRLKAMEEMFQRSFPG